MKLYARILRYLRPHSGLFALAVLAMAVFAALDAISLTLLIPFLDVLFRGQEATTSVGAIVSGSSSLVHRVLSATVGGLVPPGEPMVGLRNIVLVMFVVMLLKNIFDYIQAYLVVLIEERLTRDLRNDLYEHTLRLGLPFFHRTKVGQIISRITNDVDRLRSLVTGQLAEVVSSIMQATFLLIILLALSWKLTLLTLVTVPVMMGVWQRFRGKLHKGVLRVLDAVGEISAHVQETVSGIRLVKSAGAESFEAERFRQLTRTHYKAVVRNERWRRVFSPANEMIAATALLALLWYGSRQVLVDGTLDAQSFLAFLVTSMKLTVPLKKLGRFPSLVQPGLAAGERAFELIDTVPEVVDAPNARPVHAFNDRISFENVGFAYSADGLILAGIDLTLRVGEVVAVVGPSGAGKTTLASLLPRFYDPTVGRITLDGTDLREYRSADLRALMGIVTQETIIFHDTVRANIAYGLQDASDAAVEAAARAANAHGFIMEMPQGYETRLGERGTRLSGGQRQRIAIARALLRNPPILILDEATSSLDTQSEQLVQRAIDELLHERSVLVIAHRLSTVRRADAILVMDAGRVVQRGTHEELLAEGGLYQRLYRLQFATEDEHALGASVEPV
jgi:subfamily B ATP-binding cassette protein MsbA